MFPRVPSVRKEKYLGPDVLQGKGIKVKQYMIKAPLGKKKGNPKVTASRNNVALLGQPNWIYVYRITF